MSFMRLPLDIDPQIDMQAYMVLLFVTQHTPVDRSTVVDYDVYWADLDHTRIAVYVKTRLNDTWEVALDCSDGDWHVAYVRFTEFCASQT